MIALILASCCLGQNRQDPNQPVRDSKAAVIPIEGMIDPGLYQSIIRRSEQALSQNADYIIFEISTYGGRLDAADSIAKYLILTLAEKAAVVAYVKSEAISAGALIAVSCEEIIMRQNTTIGDAAPIVMGSKLEGVEREKAESYTRGLFERAAEANNYPEALLKAMVTMQLEVYRVKNLQTDEYEFYETEDLPNDPNLYALAEKELVVRDDEILTLTASDALEFKLTTEIVENLDGALEYLQAKYNVDFTEVSTFETNWSEEMVRWINSPAVASILVMLALLGVYIELSTPGLGLPGLVAVICFVILIGSKYLIGLANWLEIAVFVLGVILLLVEFFVIPGFGIAGIAGIVLMVAGILGMLIKNAPDEIPWPKNPMDWEIFMDGLIGLTTGFGLSIIVGLILARFLPKLQLLSGLTLSPSQPKRGTEYEVSETYPPEKEETHVSEGDTGIALTRLRPSGRAKFGDIIVDVIAENQFIDKDEEITVIKVRGNKVVVTKFIQE